LLNEQLDDRQHEAVENHVEGCATCQERLEELAVAQNEARTRARPSLDPCPGGPGASFLRSLKAQGQPREPRRGDRNTISPHQIDAGSSSSGVTARPAERRRLPTIAGFQIVRETGQGGMGVVYEAVELALGRRAALKVLLAHRAPTTSVERFHREARAAAKLHHTSIVPVFGVGEDEGQLDDVMQFIEGESLGQVFERLGRSTPPEGVIAAAPPDPISPSAPAPPFTREIGSGAESVAVYQQATSIRQRITRENPTDLLARKDRVNQTAAALRSFRAALPVLEAQVRDQPNAARWQRELANAYQGLGTAQESAGQPPLALRSLEKALTLTRALPRDHRTVISDQVHLAADISHVGLLLDLVGQPTAALRRSDPNLDPLRDREDFQVLLMDLAFPTEPFAR